LFAAVRSERKSTKGRATKTRIAETAAELIHAKGFNYTGIQEILQKAGVPKGSFYFYFSSKEALGLEIIDLHLEFFRDQVGRFLGEKEFPPLIRFRRLFNWFRGYYAEVGFTRGCPIGNLAQEMADINPLFRDRLNRALESLGAAFAEVLREARERKEWSAFVDPNEMARFIVASWQGSLLQMKLSRSAAPLNRMETLLFDHLLKPAEPKKGYKRTAGRSKTTNKTKRRKTA